MPEFKNLEKAKALCDAIFKAHDREPLYERKLVPGKGGVSAQVTFSDVISDTFAVLQENGYGTYVSDKTEAEKIIGFRKVISEGKKNTDYVARTLEGYDQKTLSQLFYSINKSAARDDRTLIDTIESTTLRVLLERAIEFGEYPKSTLG